MALIYTIALVPTVISALWFGAACISDSLPTLRGKRICLLIAHPDDEAMFFAPTLLALAQPKLENHLRILCLSTGDADGLGDVRRKELLKSGLLLGLKSAEDISVIDDPNNFPDTMSRQWDPDLMADLLAEQLAPKELQTTQHASQSSRDAHVDVIITFDSGGVSSHPNHISLNEGARAFIKRMNMEMRMQSDTSSESSALTLYALRSTNVLRKYLSILDAPMTMLKYIVSEKHSAALPSSLLFLGDLQKYMVAQKAMTTAHKSQMVWFRWGWIGVSRYMVMNDLAKEEIT